MYFFHSPLLLFSFLFLFFCSPLFAHHPTSSSSAALSLNSLQQQGAKPKSYFLLHSQVENIDDDWGSVYRLNLSGQYSVNRKMAFGLDLPFVFIHQRTQAVAQGLGDLSLTSKFLLFETENSFSANTGLNLTLPTGNEAKRLGSGDTVLSPYLSLQKSWKNFVLFLSVNSALKTASDFESTLDTALGAQYQLPGALSPLKIMFNLESNTFFSSDVFQNASSQLYVKPALALEVNPKLQFLLGGKIRFYNNLKLKPGVVLERSSSALLSDVVHGFFFDLIYSI